MRPGLVLLAVLLAACSAEMPPVPSESFRDPSAPFASIADFDPARFQGRWHEVASFPTPLRAGCRNSQSVYAPSPEGLSVRNTCVKDGRQIVTMGTARPSGPGRMEVRLDGMPMPASYWILWVDEGYRTAVIGVPSGRAGWILNRDPAIPADRLNAARKLLSFYGYDLSRLRMTPRDGS